MIEEILPVSVVAVEAWDDEREAKLFPEEELVVARAVDKRRSEFTTARMCAREALERLGFPAAPIATGKHGEPLWPVGAVGSITHCEGYRACAIGRSDEILTVGIDAEPNAPLPEGLLGDIARPEELPSLRRLESERPEVCWERLLFSAKESVYKAWFPLAQSWLGFEDAVLAFDPSTDTFSARLLVAGPQLAGRTLRGFSGSWTVSKGILATAIVVGSA